VVTVNDVLGCHSVLDIECRDRVYLKGYMGGGRPRADRPVRDSICARIGAQLPTGRAVAAPSSMVSATRL